MVCVVAVILPGSRPGRRSSSRGSTPSFEILNPAAKNRSPSAPCLHGTHNQGGLRLAEAAQARRRDLSDDWVLIIDKGALISTYTILGAPYCNYNITGPKTYSNYSGPYIS